MRKIVLITGGTSGLGLAAAITLAKNKKNYTVYATGRKFPEKTNDTGIIFSYLDVTQQESIDKLVSEIINKEGRLDILVNSAGIGTAAALEEVPIDTLQHAFDVNYFGTLRMIKAVVPHMRKQNNGLIINISSIGGLTSLPFQGVYSSTKFALEGLTEALSMELKPFGINTCLIEPGDYNTNVSKNRIVVKPENGSPYAQRLDGFFERLSTNIDKGRNPGKIGKLILKIINSKNPRLRYRSGRIFEVITPTVQRILPGRLFEKILVRFYDLK